MRKTVSIGKLLAHTNYFLATSDDTEELRIARKFRAAFMGSILHEADLYQGFGYLTEKDVPAGCAPGIRPNYETLDHAFPDSSRRTYYVHPEIVDDYRAELAFMKERDAEFFRISLFSEAR